MHLDENFSNFMFSNMEIVFRTLHRSTITLWLPASYWVHPPFGIWYQAVITKSFCRQVVGWFNPFFYFFFFNQFLSVAQGIILIKNAITIRNHHFYKGVNCACVKVTSTRFATKVPLTWWSDAPKDSQENTAQCITKAPSSWLLPKAHPSYTMHDL